MSSKIHLQSLESWISICSILATIPFLFISSRFHLTFFALLLQRPELKLLVISSFPPLILFSFFQPLLQLLSVLLVQVRFVSVFLILLEFFSIQPLFFVFLLQPKPIDLLVDLVLSKQSA